MNDPICGCPQCRKEFRIQPEFAGDVVQCPHCSQKLRVPSEMAEHRTESVSTNAVPAREDNAADDPGLRPVEFDSGNSADPANVDHLLPPQFTAIDPTRLWQHHEGPSKVLLPTAEGGLQEVNERWVTIEYKGKKYTLIAATAEEKRRRQIISNVLSILVAIAAIAGTIWVLLK